MAQGPVERYSTAAGDRWRIRYELPPGRDGKRRQRTQRGFERERDAARALREVLTSFDDHGPVEPSAKVLGESLDAWLDSRRPLDGKARAQRGRLTPSTWATYRTYVGTYVAPALGGVPLRDLRADHFERLYDDLERRGGRRGTGLSPKTVANLHGILNSALKSAVIRGLLITNPLARLEHPPRVERVRMSWWTVEQLGTFLTHVEGDRIYAAWLLFATTGMRRGEVAGLAWDDVDLDRATVTVSWQLGLVDNRPTFKPRSKTDAGRRRMSLDPHTVAVLREHRRRQLEERMAAGPIWQDVQTDEHGRSRAGLVFTREDGSLINPDWLTVWFRQHAEAAGLPRIRLHDVRHSYASAGLAHATGWAEVKVMSERLGHASIGITLDTYSHVLPDRDAEIAATLATHILGLSTRRTGEL
jgi:integrase